VKKKTKGKFNKTLVETFISKVEDYFPNKHVDKAIQNTTKFEPISLKNDQSNVNTVIAQTMFLLSTVDKENMIDGFNFFL
jgi:hypothetical protein